MNSNGKNIIIGIFVILSCVTIVWALMYLHPTIGDGKTILHVRFANIDNIAIGTRVHYAGKPIGEVSALVPVPVSHDIDAPFLDTVYAYELTLRIDSSVIVYDSDEIAVHTSGLLGEKSVMITPRPPRNGMPATIVGNEILYAKLSGSVEQSVDELTVLSIRARNAIDRVVDLIDNNDSKINTIIGNIDSSTQSLDEILDRAAATKIVDTLQSSAAHIGEMTDEISIQLNMLNERKFPENISTFTENLSEISSALNRPEDLSEIIVNIKKLSSGLDSSLSSIASAAENVNGLVSKISNSTGDLGHLINDENLYLHASSIMNKLETLMNDVNHYGLLFHLDKGWQRQRAKRIKALNEISTPQQFKNYFDEEISSMSTSAARISMALEHSPNDMTLGEKEFSEIYSDLLNQIEGLGETLRLYKEQYNIQQPSKNSYIP